MHFKTSISPIVLKTLALLQNIQIHFNKQRGKNPATLLKIKQASRRLERLACRMTMLTVMTMFLIYPFTLSHEHRHHRHYRHDYSKMTRMFYWQLKRKRRYYEKHRIRMTQMTLMTPNLGYGIGISSKQRHKRHLRHYRHARTVPGVWGTPQKCACGWPHAMLAKHVCLKMMVI